MRSNILIESDGTRVIVAQHCSPPKGQRLNDAPLVIMPHGLQKTHEHTAELFSEISERLEDIGLSSLLYDYSEQQKDFKDEKKTCCDGVIEDLTTLFVWAHENEFTKFAFVTEGLGAPLLFMNLPENSIFTVLLWPVLDIDTYVKNQSIAYPLRSAPPDEFCFDEEFLQKMKRNDLRQALENVHTPTLILQGLEDKVVTSRHLEEAREYLMAPWLDITTFEDGEHGLAKP